MKCKDFEQEIYLYEELTAPEKKYVDEHVKQCEACQQLLATIQGYQSVVRILAENIPQSSNHARLTSNILQAIANSEERQSSWLNSLFFRYAMVAASLTLVIGFGIESLSMSEPISKHYPAAETVTLNSASLAKTYRDKKEQPRPYSLYACAKSGECNDTFISNFKKKSL